MTLYQVGSIFFMMLAYLALLKATDIVGYFDLYKFSSKNFIFLIDFALFLVVVGTSLITYYLQSVLYTVAISRSPMTRFIYTAVLGIIKAYVYPKLYTMSYEILLAYAFQETSMILQYVFCAIYRVRDDDQRERLFVVNVVIFHSITFVFNDLMAVKYVGAATMAIPVMVGLLALLDYTSERFRGHGNDLMNDFAENVLEDGNGPSGREGNDHVMQMDQ